MKKVLLSLLAVAALVLSCQNYDDEFDALNAKVASLESQISSLADLRTAVTSVQSSVTALQAAVSGLDYSSDIAAILDDLGELATAIDGATTSSDLDALKAELSTSLDALKALIEANSTSIASLVVTNAGLKSQLEDLGVDVDAILAANSTFEGNLTITNAAELAYAKSLGTKVASIKGDVIVTVDEPSATAYRVANTGNGVTAAGVNTVLSQITFVVGNVRITTDASLDLSALTTVSGDYSVVGHDIDDSALASVGDDVYVDYDGPISFPALASADRIYVNGSYVTTASTSVATATAANSLKIGTTSIDFMGLTKATSLTVLSSALSNAHSSGASAVLNDPGLPAGELRLSSSTTSVKIGQAPVTLVTGGGLTDLELHYKGDLETTKATLALYPGLSSTGSAALPSLSITGAKIANATVMARRITGAVSIDVVGSTATSASGTVNFPEALNVGAISSDALVNSFPKVVTAAGVSLDNQLSVSLPELTSSTGAIVLPKATSLGAAKLVRVGSSSATGAGAAITADLVAGAVSFPALTKAGAVSMTSATSITAILAKVESINIKDATTLVPTAIKLGSVSDFTSSPGVGTISDAGNVTTVELHSQDVTYPVANFTAATSITVLGKTSAVNAVATSANALAKTITFGGKLGTASVTAGPKVTSVVTSGTIADFTVASNTLLTTLTSNHTEDASLGAKFSVTSNVKLGTFTTKVNRVTDFVVTGNKIMTHFDAASMTAVPNNAASAVTAFTINVQGNYDVKTTYTASTGTKGTYTALSATTDEAYGERSLNSLKPYLELLHTSKTGHTSGGSTSAPKPLAANTMTVTLDYISLASGTGATTAAVRTVAFAQYGKIAGE